MKTVKVSETVYWKYFGTEYKLYTEDMRVMKEFRDLSRIRKGATYMNERGIIIARDYIFPADRFAWVQERLKPIIGKIKHL